MKFFLGVFILFLSFSLSAKTEDVECQKLIVDQFKQARELYLSVSDFHSLGYQSPKVASWKEKTSAVVQKCSTDTIALPFDRTIWASDLYSLMQAYIQGKGIEEWQAKFSLALICTQSPKACEPYINEPSQEELSDIWNDVIEASKE